MTTPEERLAPSLAGEDIAPDPAERAQVEDLLLTWVRTLRAQQLYKGQSPVYDRLVESLRERLRGIWESLPSLTLAFEEEAIRWRDAPVYEPESRADPLHFPFFKDGVRELTLFPGFEDEELAALLGVLRRAHHLNPDEDDLLTLLWDAEWRCMDYHYVDVHGEEDEVEAAPSPEPVSAGAVRQEAQPALMNPVEFDESLYFLNDAELRYLAEEVEREFARDLWNGVLNALLDRLEEGDAARQVKILGVLTEVLPILLASARFAHVASVLTELEALRHTPAGLEAPVAATLERLVAQLAQPALIEELIRAVEDSPEDVDPEAFGAVLGYVSADALGPLVRALETSPLEAARAAIAPAAERLARAAPDRLIALLADPDAATLAGAARLAGRIGHMGVVPALTRLLEHPESALRLAAIEALFALRSPGSGGALSVRLGDPEREVRIVAARTLGMLRYLPARQALLAAISSPRMKDADTTERIALYEAYGSVAGEEAVPMLARLLNGRSWMGRKEAAETRACAALGLARTRSAAAARELSAAAADPEPAVRTAVARALRVLAL